MEFCYVWLRVIQARRSKRIVLADECRNQLLEGIQQVADAVRVSLRLKVPSATRLA